MTTPYPPPTQFLIFRVSTTLFWWNMVTQAIVKVTESYLYWHWWFFNFTSAPHQKPASLMNYFWLACSWGSSGFQLWLHIRISWGAWQSYQYSDFITVLLIQSCCGREPHPVGDSEVQRSWEASQGHPVHSMNLPLFDPAPGASSFWKPHGGGTPPKSRSKQIIYSIFIQLFCSFNFLVLGEPLTLWH